MAKTLTILRRLFGGHDEDRCVRGSRCRIYNGRRSRSHEQGLQDESSPLVCSGVLREEWKGAKPWWTDASARASRCTSRLGSGFLSTLPFAIKRPATRGDHSVDFGTVGKNLSQNRKPESAAGVADGTYRLADDCHNEIPSMHMKPTAAIAAWRQL